MSEERTNRTYILDENGEEITPVIVPTPNPSIPKQWPKPPKDETPAEREKEE